MQLHGVTSLRIAATSGSVRVIAEERQDVQVSGTMRVNQNGSVATVEAESESVEVRIPAGLDVMAGSTSASITVEGRVGHLAVVTESGRITMEHSASLDARTVSGRVEASRVDDDCRIHTESGKVTVHVCHDCDVSTVSGRVELSDVSGVARANCVSGRVDIHMTEPHDVTVETVSGRVSVSLPGGARVRRSDDGHGAALSDPECDCTVTARSVSGRVDVVSR
jgi:DUF4097 and DUF4098 domain-containing protein YvlB